jgi:hypothetical protein
VTALTCVQPLGLYSAPGALPAALERTRLRLASGKPVAGLPSSHDAVLTASAGRPLDDVALLVRADAGLHPSRQIPTKSDRPGRMDLPRVQDDGPHLFTAFA